jgi:hypothetical protein
MIMALVSCVITSELMFSKIIFLMYFFFEAVGDCPTDFSLQIRTIFVGSFLRLLNC